MIPNDIERLLIVDACRQLIHRYAFLNDARDYTALVELFTVDAELRRPSAPEQPIVGRDAILAAFQGRPATAATFHLCTDVLVDVLSPTTARARSRILLLSGSRPEGGGVPDAASMKPVLPGTFSDELVLGADGWKFSKRSGALWMQPTL